MSREDNKTLKEQKSRIKKKHRIITPRRKKTEENSLANLSTPKDYSSQTKKNPKDDIQDRKLLPKSDNIVTVAAVNNIKQDKTSSSESFSDSDTSDIEVKELIPTAKKKTEEERNSPITASTPFNLNMSTIFDAPMAHIINDWQDATSANNDMRLILIAIDIKTYNSIESLDKEEIYSLEQIKTSGTPKRL